MSTDTATTESPVCQKHSARVAVGTCTRCGRFVCDACAGEQRVCPECVTRQLQGLPSSAPRARWATRFLSANVAFDALSVLVGLWAMSSPEPSELRDVAEALVGLGALGLLLGTAITFLRWLHLAVRQAQALAIDVGVTPGWAVGYWFIPFANLVKPYHTVRNLLAGLGGKSLVASARVGMWWGLWIIGNMLSQIQARMSVSGGLEAQAPSEAYAVGILSSLLSLVSAILCIGIVRAAQQALDAKRP
jgi:hypothetical protein